YSIVNVGEQPRKVAPWELLRAPASAGFSFFPSGRGVYPQSTLKLDARSTVTWFVHTDGRKPRPLKAYADGQDGWLALVSGDLLLVRSFADAEPSSLAPGEAEIEILADYDLTTQQHRYVEVGVQGAYLELAPGARRDWIVRWFLRRLPDSVSAQAGSQELIGFVKAVVETR
ncbi:MAG TPA: hypothetical protein VEQ59_12690, partial [Polyangiaceae bacterium]|nr:hypothetical protein [Polyangiaceae bacterium]